MLLKVLDFHSDPLHYTMLAWSSIIHLLDLLRKRAGLAVDANVVKRLSQYWSLIAARVTLLAFILKTE